jgi:murein DD-endopeptidase MepM/ murein hydrolase activator NlpD
MEILFVGKSRGRRARLELNAFTVSAALSAALVLVGLSAVFGFRLGSDRTAEQILNSAPNSVQYWQDQITQQRQEISAVRRQQTSNFDALALRAGHLRAHVTRLNAMGSRMVEMADLPPGEFDFSADPALGGPQYTGYQRSAELGEVLDELDRLAAQLRDSDEQLVVMEEVLRDRDLHAQISPTGKPVASGWISSGFGKRSDPVTGKQKFHRGVDFAGRAGSQVLAVASGVVTGSDRRAGYGNMVEISHGNGFVTRYSHNSENAVKKGETVDKGQLIAKMGSTGRATGPHVHFEVVRDGKIVNPSRYIRKASK